MRYYVILSMALMAVITLKAAITLMAIQEI